MPRDGDPGARHREGGRGQFPAVRRRGSGTLSSLACVRPGRASARRYPSCGRSRRPRPLQASVGVARLESRVGIGGARVQGPRQQAWVRASSQQDEIRVVLLAGAASRPDQAPAPAAAGSLSVWGALVWSDRGGGDCGAGGAVCGLGALGAAARCAGAGGGSAAFSRCPAFSRWSGRARDSGAAVAGGGDTAGGTVDLAGAGLGGAAGGDATGPSAGFLSARDSALPRGTGGPAAAGGALPAPEAEGAGGVVRCTGGRGAAAG